MCVFAGKCEDVVGRGVVGEVDAVLGHAHGVVVRYQSRHGIGDCRVVNLHRIRSLVDAVAEGMAEHHGVVMDGLRGMVNFPSLDSLASTSDSSISC